MVSVASVAACVSRPAYLKKAYGIRCPCSWPWCPSKNFPLTFKIFQWKCQKWKWPCPFKRWNSRPGVGYLLIYTIYRIPMCKKLLTGSIQRSCPGIVPSLHCRCPQTSRRDSFSTRRWCHPPEMSTHPLLSAGNRRWQQLHNRKGITDLILAFLKASQKPCFYWTFFLVKYRDRIISNGGAW